ncbi:MAG TPA: hypothetical protein VD813_12760 [Pseudonocardia sp.]|nr:hypothetical protein [Pseudonocardia sp.]
MRSRIEALRGEMRVPLYRNAYTLMLNTALNSVLGLLYWIVAARTFPEDEVGRGNALLSAMMLVSVLTQLNFGSALIRFLPRAGAGSRRLVLTAYSVAAGLAALGATAVVAFWHLALEPGDPLHVSAWFGVWFVVSTVCWSIFNLQDSALTGLRSPDWIPVENGLFGVVKLGLLVVLAGTAVGEAVFTSWTLPVLAFLVPVNLLIFLRVLPRHRADTAAQQVLPTRRGLARYMAGDYTGQVFAQLSSTFLPVLVVALLGPAQGAYLVPAQTALIALNLLSVAITSSLVVEAARDGSRAPQYAAAVLRRIGVTVVPAALLIAVAAPWLLELFGPTYRENATLLMQLLMLSTLPRVVVSLYATMCRLRERTGRLALVQCAEAVLLVGGTVAFSGTLGLVAVGWSALAGQLVLAVVVAPRVIAWLAPARRRAGRSGT